MIAFPSTGEVSNFSSKKSNVVCAADRVSETITYMDVADTGQGSPRVLISGDKMPPTGQGRPRVPMSNYMPIDAAEQGETGRECLCQAIMPIDAAEQGETDRECLCQAIMPIDAAKQGETSRGCLCRAIMPIDSANRAR